MISSRGRCAGLDIPPASEVAGPQPTRSMLRCGTTVNQERHHYGCQISQRSLGDLDVVLRGNRLLLICVTYEGSFWITVNRFVSVHVSQGFRVSGAVSIDFYLSHLCLGAFSSELRVLISGMTMRFVALRTSINDP